MRKMVFALVLGLSVLFSNLVYGGNYLTIGSSSCGAVLDADAANNKTAKKQIKDWAMGYVTGRNYAERKFKTENMPGSAQSTANSIYYAVIKYCRENPLKSTSHAMEHIYNNELY